MARQTRARNYLFWSDPHDGSIDGLHHPDDQIFLFDHPEKDRFRKLQREQWNWWAKNIDNDGPFDAAICLGDGIDGSQKKQKGMGLMHRDRKTQASCFAHVLESIPTKHHYLVAGTPYHTGSGESWEQVAADQVDGRNGLHATFRRKLEISLNGIVTIARHKIGNSSIPHGRGTAPLRGQLNNLLSAMLEQDNRADLMIWGHLHKYIKIENDFGVAVVLPACSSGGTRHGEEACDGPLTFGYVVVRVEDPVEWRQRPICYRRFAKLKNRVPEIIQA